MTSTASDEIVSDVGPDLLLHAKGATRAHCDVGIVGQACDDPLGRFCGLVWGPADVHEHEAGATVHAAQVFGSLVTKGPGDHCMHLGLDDLPHSIPHRCDIGAVDSALAREHLDDQIRGRAEVLVQENVGLRRFRRRVGVSAHTKLVGH